MTVYQVLNEQNQPVYEADTFLNAFEEAELLNQSQEDHFFFVEAAALQTQHLNA